jgi:hypothetical protein
VESIFAMEPHAPAATFHTPKCSPYLSGTHEPLHERPNASEAREKPGLYKKFFDFMEIFLKID